MWTLGRSVRMGRGIASRSSLSTATLRTKQLAAHMTTMPEQDPPVLFREDFAARIFTLNRPAQYNALNHEMIMLLRAKIDVR